MKKILLLCMIALCVPSFAAAKGLTFGDTLTLYFSEIFPVVDDDIDSIIVQYSDVGQRQALRMALQRGIFYGMMPNTDTALHPDTSMTDRAFSQLLHKHFGVEIHGDSSVLTQQDYDRYMQSIRESYTYRLLRSINQNTTASIIAQPSENPALEDADKYHILDDVYSTIRQGYLHANSTEDSDLIYGATEGLINQLDDPYTKFFRPEASTDFYQTLSGKIAGIGVIVDTDSRGGIVITDVIDHSPAEKAGILPQDVIVKIGSIIVTTEDGLDDDIARLRGKEGTSVNITLISDKKVKIVSVVRAFVSVPLINEKNLQDTYYIRYREVAFDSDDLVGEALQDFLDSGKKRLILDLRDNPGGSMLETRNILNFFIDRGKPLVILRYADNEIVHESSQNRMTDWSQYEIVILVNHDTASAAEVIASVLREYFPKNVVIIGETSYGKGTVQELVSFSDNSLLKYTIAEWLTPKKNSINKVGITPDKTIPFDEQLWKDKKIDIQMLAGEKYRFGK